MGGVSLRVRRSHGVALVAAALLLITVTLALYAPSLAQPFTSDDYQYLYGCTRLGHTSVLAVFHPAVQAIVLPPFYRPTSVAFFLALSRFFGPEPVPFHVCLLLLRVATLLLAVTLFTRLFGHVGWGTVAALALAVCPFGIEPGLWPAAVPDSLLGLSLLGALVCFDQLGRLEARTEKQGAADQPSRQALWGWLVGTVACGLLALASKEPAVVLPLLLACLPGRCRRMGRTAILAVLCADGLYLLLRLWMRIHIPPPPGYDYWYLLQRLQQWEGWKQVALSLGMVMTGPSVLPAVPYLGLGLLGIAIVLVARSHRGVSGYVLALAVVMLLPLVLTGGLTTPRYGYVPAIGTILIVAALARLGWRGRGRWIIGGLLVAWIGFQAGFSRFWIGEWMQAARSSEKVAQLLASRPADEQTVLLWIPGSRVGFFGGTAPCVSQSLTDSIYPAWIKALQGKGAAVVPLTVADALGDGMPETRRPERDVVEIRSDRHYIRLAGPSPYTSGTEPNVTACTERLAQEAMRLQLRLRRAPHRVFFTLTDHGWEEL